MQSVNSAKLWTFALHSAFDIPKVVDYSWEPKNSDNLLANKENTKFFAFVLKIPAWPATRFVTSVANHTNVQIKFPYINDSTNIKTHKAL